MNTIPVIQRISTKRWSTPRPSFDTECDGSFNGLGSHQLGEKGA